MSISPVSSGFSCFFYLNLAHQNTVLITFSFWHRLTREALFQEEEKTGIAEHDRPAEWEGSSAGGMEGGGIICILCFLYSFPFGRPPGGSTLESAFHRKQAGRSPLLPVTCDSNGDQSRRQAFECVADRKLLGRSIDHGNFRSDRGSESIGQSVYSSSLE